MLSPFARTVGFFSFGSFPRYFSSSLFVSLYNFTSDTLQHRSSIFIRWLTGTAISPKQPTSMFPLVLGWVFTAPLHALVLVLLTYYYCQKIILLLKHQHFDLSVQYLGPKVCSDTVFLVFCTVSWAPTWIQCSRVPLFLQRVYDKVCHRSLFLHTLNVSDSCHVVQFQS